jgi:hypothetical protein
MIIYVVDTNFFIQAHRVSYPLDVAHSFWNKVKQLVEEGKIISVDKVKNEIYKNEDDLKRWCEDNLPNIFFKDTTTVFEQYKQIVNWATSKSDHYLPNARAEFLNADEADAFLVSYALADKNNRIIVTYEISEPYKKNRIKIPDVCLANDIQYTNTIEMFRKLKEQF